MGLCNPIATPVQILRPKEESRQKEKGLLRTSTMLKEKHPTGSIQHHHRFRNRTNRLKIQLRVTDSGVPGSSMRKMDEDRSSLKG